MTDLLTDTLTEYADGVEPPELDLDAIISTGDRRVRRRRTLAIAGTAVVTLAVLATGLTLAKTPDDQPPPVVVGEPFAQRRATYAIGSEIHFGQDVISVAPKKVSTFVQTDSGFVFTDLGTPGVFLTDGKQVRRLGSTEGPSSFGELVAGKQGNLVGWSESIKDGSESVVYDVAADREVLRTTFGNDRPFGDWVQAARMIAIDDGNVYLGAHLGAYRWNLATGEHQLIADTLPNGIRDVSSGQYLYQRPLHSRTDGSSLGGGTSLAVGPKPSDSTGRDFPGQQGYLSPSAKYLLTATNGPQKIKPPPADLKLFVTATGQSLALRHPDHPRLIFSQWLTDDTFTAVGVGAKPNSPVDLLTCSITSLDCRTTVAGFSTFTFSTEPPRTPPFVLPIGALIFWLYG